MRKLKIIFFHTGIVCIMARIIIFILDWYNPYMDFAGHAGFLPIIFFPAAGGYLFFDMIFSKRYNHH